jgi:peroxiredoxin
MAQFESQKEEIGKTGARLAYVAAQTRGGVFDPEKFFVENSISFPFLLDEDRSVTKAYGVYQWLGFDGVNIAHPATFVIDTTGVVRHIYVGGSQWNRMPLDELIAIVGKIQQPRRKARA